MNKKLVDKKHISAFVMLCGLLYAVSYITRINFAAIISEIVRVEGITKSEASLVTTALFIAYGSGQLIFGVIGDKVNPAKLIAVGMVCTAVLNFLMGFFSGNIQLMCAIWFLNGFAQAIMWPSLVKITCDYLSMEEYKKACISIGVSCNAATVGIYIVAPILIEIIHYKFIFLICGAVGVLMAIFWTMKIGTFKEKCVYTEEENIPEENETFVKTGIGAKMVTILVIIGIASLIHGILKDGITTWTPSFVQEVYSLPSSFSILITVLIPIFSIITHKVGGYIHRKFIKNELLCGGVFYAVAAISAFILTATYNGNPIISVFLAAIITGCMHGINIMLMCMLPGRFEKQGKVATISGTLNFVAYIGSSISTYLIASFAEIYNWRATILLWAMFAVVGMIICVTTSKFFKIKEDA